MSEIRGDAKNINVFEPPTPDEVITEIRGKLGEQVDLDRDLSAILEAHILTETPNEQAVTDTAVLILALANKRSAEANHDNNN